MRPRRRLAGLVLATSGWLLACVPTHIQIIVRAAATTNGGLPTYMLVRTVSDTEYLTETYEAVAHHVVRPDPAVMFSKAIYPGHESTFTVGMPKQPIGIYFMFTDPGIRWRAILEPPFGGSCEIHVDANEIQDMKCAEPPASAQAPAPGPAIQPPQAQPPPGAPAPQAPAAPAPQAPQAPQMPQAPQAPQMPQAPGGGG